jgi:hypothetical protein
MIRSLEASVNSLCSLAGWTACPLVAQMYCRRSQGRSADTFFWLAILSLVLHAKRVYKVSTYTTTTTNIPNMSDSESQRSASASPEVTEKKRKRTIVAPEDELEIDINLPEPASKKAKRKEKKEKKEKKAKAENGETEEVAKPAAAEPPAPGQRSEYGIWRTKALTTRASPACTCPRRQRRRAPHDRASSR